MKRFWLILSFFLLPLPFLRAQYEAPPAFASLYDSETVAALKTHVDYLTGAQMEGRKAGSEGEALAAEYVRDVLKS